MKVVITDHRFPDVEQERLAVESVDGTLVVAQTLDEQKLADACKDADGVIASRALVYSACDRSDATLQDHCPLRHRSGHGGHHGGDRARHHGGERSRLLH